MCNLPCRLRQLDNRIKYTCGSPQHRNASHPRLTASTLNPIIARISKSKTPCDEARDCWKNRKGRWVRVHGIARRTLFDPMHDEQPFCQYLTARRRTTVRFLGQQSEITIDDTSPQLGEMRSLLEKYYRIWDTNKICHRTTPGNPTNITAT